MVLIQTIHFMLSNHPAYITGIVQYQGEDIDYKIIRSEDSLVYIDELANLQFDFDQGFDIQSDEDFIMTLTFQDHFSTFNTVELGVTIDASTQLVTPNRLDIMRFKGDYITMEGTETDDGTDSILFINDLVNGGMVNGDFDIESNLYVLTEYGFIGDISEMDGILFPFRHVVSVNSQIVEYEYVLTENVGIYTSTPEYALDINGDSYISQNLISPSVNITGDWLSSHDYYTFLSYTDFVFDTNRNGSLTESTLLFNDLIFDSTTNAGLNNKQSDYRFMIYPYLADADLIIEGDKPFVTFYSTSEKFGGLRLDGNDDLIVESSLGVNRLVFTVGDEQLMQVNEFMKLGVGTLESALRRFRC